MEEVKAKLKEELATLEDELHFKLPKEIQKAREFLALFIGEILTRSS